jgi:hypothetical protein
MVEKGKRRMIENMSIQILEIYKLSFGNLYTIQFPKFFIPLPGFRFYIGSELWEIKAIAMSYASKLSFENTRNYIYDCMLINLELEKELAKGQYEIIPATP